MRDPVSSRIFNQRGDPDGLIEVAIAEMEKKSETDLHENGMRAPRKNVI